MRTSFGARTTVAVVVSFLFGASMAGGIAMATTSSPTISACAAHSTGVLRLITHGSCHKGERKIAWAAAGVPGPRGLTGKTGAPGAPGAPGTPGPPGAPGGAASAPATLPSGQSERGPWATAGNNAGGRFGFTFNPPLAAPLDGAHMHYLPSGAARTTACPGAGQAAPGNLCVYAAVDESFAFFSDPETNTGSSQTYGVNAVWYVDMATSGGSGSWTLTAP